MLLFGAIVYELLLSAIVYELLLGAIVHGLSEDITAFMCGLILDLYTWRFCIKVQLNVGTTAQPDEA